MDEKMIVFDSPDKLCFMHTAVALGDFDGVHAAHREVITASVRAAKEKNLKSGVLLFKNNLKNAPYISSLDEKIKLIEDIGVDFVCLAEFCDFRQMSREEFCVFLKEVMHTDFVSAGYNYRFGYKAEGDAEYLKELGKKTGIEVGISEPQRIGDILISSTEIRNMLKNPNLNGVKKLLGRSYSISGKVTNGFQNGRKLGFKTANVEVDENRCLPADGVYAGKAIINGEYKKCVINIGKNPTFDAVKRTVEAHILDFDCDIYGEKIKLIFEEFIRGEKRFDSIDELKKQIESDKERAEKIMKEFRSVILAAGMGTRMKSETPKVLHKICGKSLVEWVLKATENAGASDSCVIVGHKAEMVKEVLGEDVKYALQKEQKGTGHAIMQAADFISASSGNILILCGDAPLVTEETIKNAMDAHEKSGAAATVITAVLPCADGYGRIIRDADSNVLGIVEHADATEEQRQIREVNSGMYIFDSDALSDALKKLTPNNAQGEYYLTDTLGILLSSGKKIAGYPVSDEDEIRGINDRIQLAEAEKIMQGRINKMHMRNGVTMILPESIIIEDDVEIGNDTVIYPNVILRAGTRIGKNCMIGSNTQITNSIIEDNVEILSSVLLSCSVGEGTGVGPFAYLRPDTHVGKNVRVGDFVELKNSNIDDGTKISHLTYVGDSDVGKRVNFGCGTVTVNYDGKKKYRTKIGDDCFIGCNTNLVAPVTVENGGYTAAGSTITDTVPEDALAIARARQINKTEWKDRRK